MRSSNVLILDALHHLKNGTLTMSILAGNSLHYQRKVVDEESPEAR
jgi:hypothetical protein